MLAPASHAPRRASSPTPWEEGAALSLWWLWEEKGVGSEGQPQNGWEPYTVRVQKYDDGNCLDRQFLFLYPSGFFLTLRTNLCVFRVLIPISRSYLLSLKWKAIQSLTMIRHMKQAEPQSVCVRAGRHFCGRELEWAEPLVCLGNSRLNSSGSELGWSLSLWNFALLVAANKLGILKINLSLFLPRWKQFCNFLLVRKLPLPYWKNFRGLLVLKPFLFESWRVFHRKTQYPFFK